MKKLGLCFMFIASVCFAHPRYQTDRELKIGDTYNPQEGTKCVVKAQLDLGPGSQPLITMIARAVCGPAYKGKLKEDQIMQTFIKTLMNGNSQIVNCMICTAPTVPGDISKPDFDGSLPLKP